MRNFRTAACGLIAALLFAGCGNATSNMGFTVPAGYQSKFNLFGSEMWTAGQAARPSFIMLMTIPKKFDVAKTGNGFDFGSIPSQSVKNARVTERKAIVMCGHQTAFEAKAVGTTNDKAANKNGDEDIEMIVTGWGNSTYMAMYGHPHSMPADPASEAALMTLCPKTS
jgi:hypothetical protein